MRLVFIREKSCAYCDMENAFRRDVNIKSKRSKVATFGIISRDGCWSVEVCKTHLPLGVRNCSDYEQSLIQGFSSLALEMATPEGVAFIAYYTAQSLATHERLFASRSSFTYK